MSTFHCYSATLTTTLQHTGIPSYKRLGVHLLLGGLKLILYEKIKIEVGHFWGSILRPLSRVRTRPPMRIIPHSMRYNAVWSRPHYASILQTGLNSDSMRVRPNPLAYVDSSGL